MVDNIYGVATNSRLLKITGLFCKRDLKKRRYSAKETYNFEEPTNRSHRILGLQWPPYSSPSTYRHVHIYHCTKHSGLHVLGLQYGVRLYKSTSKKPRIPVHQYTWTLYTRTCICVLGIRLFSYGMVLFYVCTTITPFSYEMALF